MAVACLERLNLCFVLTPSIALPMNVSALIVAVARREYVQKPLSDILTLLKPNGVFCNIKSACDTATVNKAGHVVRRL